MTQAQAGMLVGGGGPLALVEARAKGRARGLLFELAVEQHYHNPGGNNLEVVYTFPLAWGAVLLAVEVELGEKRLTGVVTGKHDAEQQYEEALAEGDTAIMLERAADGLCTMNLGNLMAGERAVIRYRYAQLVRVEHGCVRITIPTVVAPRYGDPGAAGMQPHQATDHSLHIEYPFSLELEIAGALGKGNISSPSHTIEQRRNGDAITVTLPERAYLDRDVVLRIEDLKAAAMSLTARDGDHFVTLAGFVPPPARQATRPGAFKILIDSSGSMQGDSIRSAARAAREVVDRLTPGDCFCVSRFGDTVAHGFRSLAPAQGRHLDHACAMLGELRADMGGTQMAAALRSTYALKAAGAAADVLLITDGEVWDVEQLVKEARESHQRVFAIGVGSAPAESLLRRLAEETGGACELVTPNDWIEGAAVRMLGRMRSPRYESISIDWGAVPEWTAGLPKTVYAGDPVYAFARLSAHPERRATLSYCESGEDPVSVEAAAPELHDDPERTLARMAAAMRLAWLGEAEARALAVEYQLLSQHTNFVVVHERAAGEKAQAMPRLAKAPQMIAAGWGGLGIVPFYDCLESLPVEAKANRRRGRSEKLRSFLDVEEDIFGLRRDLSLPRQAEASPDRHFAGDAPNPHAFLREISWHLIDENLPLPVTILEMRKLGAPRHICEELTRLTELGVPEVVVVKAFLCALSDRPFAEHAMGRVAHRYFISVSREILHAPRLKQKMNELMSGVTDADWPGVEAWHCVLGNGWSY